jgi:HK97 family phage major capsid protein
MPDEILATLSKEWEEFKHVADERADEIKRLGSETGETKQKLDRIQETLDEVELRFERMSLERTSAPSDTPEMKAFLGWARKGEVGPEEHKDLVFSSEDAAAVLAPAELITSMLEKAYSREPLLQLVTTKRISRATVMYPNKTVRGVAIRDGAAPDFSVESAGSTGTYGKGEIAVYGAHAIADIEATSLEDPSIDLAADLMSDWSYSFGEMEGVEILTGTAAAKQCVGILAAAHAAEVTKIKTGDIAKITYASLVDTSAALHDAYEANATWLLNKKTLHEIRKIEDTEGHLVWQPELVAGNPGTILGFPYRKSANMADIAADAIVALLGDFAAAYWLVQRIDVQVQRDPFTQWPHVRFKARKRSGGDLVMGEAVKALQTKV